MVAQRKSKPGTENRADGRPVELSKLDRFQAATREYVERITEIFTNPDFREHPAKAYNDCVRVLYDQQLPAELRRELADAYEKILVAWQEQTRAADMQPTSSLADAYNHYTRLLADAVKDRQDRIAAAQQYYSNVVRNTPAQLNRQVENVYRTYVRSLHAAWNELNPDTLDVSDLLDIHHSITQVLADQIAAVNAISTGVSPGSSSAMFSPASDTR